MAAPVTPVAPMLGISTVKALRMAITSFPRVRPDQRGARLAQILKASDTLGTDHLSWVSNFLAKESGGASS
jgi:hypothetical protein